jgi:ABC-2 type transport system permease protein
MMIIFESIKLNFKIHFQYRASYFFQFIFDVVLLLFKIQLFKMIYLNNPTNIILGYSFSQMIWYFAGINFMYYLIWNDTDKNISNNVISGDMTTQLSKPISLIQLEFSKEIASKVYAIVIDFLPSLIVYSFFVYPDFLTVDAFSKFIMVSMFSFVMFFLFNFLLGLCSFIVQNNESLLILKVMIIYIAAGAFFPIEFYPEIFQRIIRVLPFQYLFYIPIQFLLNKPETRGFNAFISTILIQIFWIILFYILYRIFWGKAVKKFCANGG